MAMELETSEGVPKLPFKPIKQLLLQALLEPSTQASNRA